jgi:hypothetical protein
MSIELTPERAQGGGVHQDRPHSIRRAHGWPRGGLQAHRVMCHGLFRFLIMALNYLKANVGILRNYLLNLVASRLQTLMSPTRSSDPA